MKRCWRKFCSIIDRWEFKIDPNVLSTKAVVSVVGLIHKSSSLLDRQLQNPQCLLYLYQELFLMLHDPEPLVC